MTGKKADIIIIMDDLETKPLSPAQRERVRKLAWEWFTNRESWK